MVCMEGHDVHVLRRNPTWEPDGTEIKGSERKRKHERFGSPIRAGSRRVTRGLKDTKPWQRKVADWEVYQGGRGGVSESAGVGGHVLVSCGPVGCKGTTLIILLSTRYIPVTCKGAS